MRRIVVLGSTGSIGTQTLDVVRQHSDKLKVVGLAVNTRTQDMLAQAKEFGRRGEKYAAQQWARLQHFLRTDATCQKLKATAQQSLQQARTLAATQWAKVSPKGADWSSR